MNKIYIYFLLFIIYSFIGWLIEVTLYLVNEKRFVNRGFLIGPYLPIYGSGATIMILYLNQYKDNLVTVFLLSIVICSIIEYFISYLMEKLFNARWWDYSTRKYNLNGRICLNNSVLFGLLGVILIYLVNPCLYSLLSKIPENILQILTIIIFLIFIADFIFSFIITNKLKNSIKNIKKDNTDEFKEELKRKIESKILNRRIFNSYPKYKINIIKLKEIKEKLEKNKEN